MWSSNSELKYHQLQKETNLNILHQVENHFTKPTTLLRLL